MNIPVDLPIESILDSNVPAPNGLCLGRSRDDHEIRGFVFGKGSTHVSLIGGCHADEPVGPAMLEKLAGFLSSLESNAPLLTEITWWLVPHVNPDGRLRNETWSRSTVSIEDHLGNPALGYQLDAYVRNVVRELPGDDIEFGFPRSNADTEARPENRAVAEFISAGAPYDLHGSFHGMGLAPGPWFLIEEAWVSRTVSLRRNLRRRVREMNYGLFDPDRKGEKGFRRIDAGFSTRPDSVAMRAFFEARRDTATASRFRPSSMEYVRALGGDPLTFVSEMPLFLIPSELEGKPVEVAEIQLIRSRLDERLHRKADCATVARELGVEPMPIRDQQRLQLNLLEEALRTVTA